MNEMEIDPQVPCAFCTGDSAVILRWENGKPVYMTSWEWCQKVRVCAATVDWDAVNDTR